MCSNPHCRCRLIVEEWALGFSRGRFNFRALPRFNVQRCHLPHQQQRVASLNHSKCSRLYGFCAFTNCFDSIPPPPAIATTSAIPIPNVAPLTPIVSSCWQLRRCRSSYLLNRRPQRTRSNGIPHQCLASLCPAQDVAGPSSRCTRVYWWGGVSVSRFTSCTLHYSPFIGFR